jgi:hypothetical protein
VCRHPQSNRDDETGANIHAGRVGNGCPVSLATPPQQTFPEAGIR